MPTPETRHCAAVEAARRARSVARVCRALERGQWAADPETLAGLADLAATVAILAAAAERDLAMS